MDERTPEHGSASVEQVGLAALLALLLIAAIAAVTAGGEIDAGRSLGAAIGRKLACGPRLPDDCHHHPLVPAYGWPLARLARALAPPPVALPGTSGLPLMPRMVGSTSLRTMPNLVASMMLSRRPFPCAIQLPMIVSDSPPTLPGTNLK